MTHTPSCFDGTSCLWLCWTKLPTHTLRRFVSRDHSHVRFRIELATQRSHIIETEPFQDTFGPKAQRKKPHLVVGSFEELGKASAVAARESEEQNEAATNEPAGIDD